MQHSPVYSRVARVNHGPLIFTSGLYAEPSQDPRDEVSELFGRLKTVLDEAGSDFRHLAKATYYVTRSETTKAMADLRPRYYDPKRPPSASLALVAGTGRPNTTVTLDVIAVPSQR
jgi:enamine deaminase RidA (YjgF/YER057c/UK114 family)